MLVPPPYCIARSWSKIAPICFFGFVAKVLSAPPPLEGLVSYGRAGVG